MIKRYTLISILFSLIIFACTQQEKKKSDLQFSINENLLGLTFQDTMSHLTLRIPKGWLPLSSFDSATQTKFNSLKDEIGFQDVFIDSLQQGGSLMIKSLINIDTVSISNMYRDPETAFNQQKVWNQIMKSSFYYNDLLIKQFLLQNNDLVSFKLIISEGLSHPIQLDYILSRNTYMLEVKKIESSIGSINSL